MAGATSSGPAFRSRLGFVLTGVGFAVGLGNIWRFPQLTSQNGGAAFVFVYLAVVALIAVPLLWAELSLGQRGRGSVLGTIKAVAGPRWQWVGFLFLAATFFGIGYYHILSGMVLRYLLTSPLGAASSDPAGYLARASEGPDAIIFGAIFIAVATIVVSTGAARTLERANMIMMPGMFGLLLVLAIVAMLQPGAGAGLDFYLRFDASEVTGSTIVAAVGQAFFSVGVAMGFHLTIGAYTVQKKPMFSNAAFIAGADALVAFVAGFVVFPFVFATGLQSQVLDAATSNATALFLTLPSAFDQIGGAFGRLLMIAFFLALFFAALSSSIALLAVIVGQLQESFGWSRRTAALVTAEFGFVPGVLAGMYNSASVWFDTLVGSVLLFLGGTALCIMYAVAIKDRLGFLLGGDEAPESWLQSAAKAVGFAIAYGIPSVLILLFVFNLPAPLGALF